MKGIPASYREGGHLMGTSSSSPPPPHCMCLLKCNLQKKLNPKTNRRKKTYCPFQAFHGGTNSHPIVCWVWTRRIEGTIVEFRGKLKRSINKQTHNLRNNGIEKREKIKIKGRISCIMIPPTKHTLMPWTWQDNDGTVIVNWVKYASSPPTNNKLANKWKRQ